MQAPKADGEVDLAYVVMVSATLGCIPVRTGDKLHGEDVRSEASAGSPERRA